MKKKIAINELMPGMFIADLNCGFKDHPFASNRFMVRNSMTVAKIRTLGIKEVWIDTNRGRDIPRPASQPAQGSPDGEDKVSISNGTFGGEVVIRKAPSAIPLREEIRMARRTHHEASQTITNIMRDVRLGKNVDPQKTAPVVERLTDSIFRNQNALLSLGRIRNQDQYTFQHSVSVSVLMMVFARNQGLDMETIHHIGQGALLHDIGKVKIPNEILNKPGKLTDDEFSIMKNHARYSGEILADTQDISPICIDVASQHHERWDGSGYPKGLKGNQISPYAQMAAIADVYDAITSDRCYHKGQPPTMVLRRLMEWSKQHFSPKLVQQFIQCVGIYPPGTLVRLKSGKLAIVMESSTERDGGQRDLLQPVVRTIFCTQKKRYIKPELIDLSNRDEVFDSVAASEDPAKWGITVEHYIGTK